MRQMLNNKLIIVYIIIKPVKFYKKQHIENVDNFAKKEIIFIFDKKIQNNKTCHCSDVIT